MKRFFAFVLAFWMILSACANDIDATSSVSSEESFISSEGSSEDLASNEVSSEEPVSSEESVVAVSSEETVSKEPKPFVPVTSVSDYFEKKTFSLSYFSYSIEYLFHEPMRDTGEKRPLVIFLHGLRDSVTINDLGTADPIVKSLMALENEDEKYSTYALVPSTPLPNEGWWNDTQLSLFKHMIKELVKEYNIDPCRVYISGISMGGMVTCQLVNEMMPYSFAAAVPMSGAYNLTSPDMVHDTAFRIYHSAVDGTVNVSQSRNLAKQLKDSGHPKFEYIEFKEGSHVSPIYKVFRDNRREFFDWLFEQKLPNSTLTMPF